MKTTEIFSGTKSFSKVMAMRGHDTVTFDNDARLDPTHCGDIVSIWENKNEDLVRKADIMWASPPCQGFSVAVIGRNWNHDGTPKTDSARLAMKLAQTTLAIIKQTQPKWWFIENPRGMLRKMEWMEQFMKEQGGGPSRNLVLPLWRQSREAYRHLDERAVVETATPVSQPRRPSRRRLLLSRPYSRVTGITHRNARHEECYRSRTDTSDLIRRDPLSNDMTHTAANLEKTLQKTLNEIATLGGDQPARFKVLKKRLLKTHARITKDYPDLEKVINKKLLELQKAAHERIAAKEEQNA